MRAVRGIRLRHDLVRSAELVEVVYVERAEIDLQCLEQVRQLHALTLHLLAIHVDIELRDVDLVGAEGRRQRGILRSLLDGVLYGRVQGIGAKITAVLHVELEAAESAHSHDRRSRDYDNEGVLDDRELLIQGRRDRLGSEILALAFLEIVESEEHQRRARARYQTVYRHTGELHGAGNAGCLEADLANFAGDLVGALDGCRGRQLTDRDHILFILVWDEAGGNCVEPKVGECDQSGVNRERNSTTPHCLCNRTRVDVACADKGAVEALEEPTEQPVHDPREEVRLRSVRLQQHSG